MSWALVMVLTLLNFGCTKEKAEAIKTGAEQFRVQAKAAIDQIRILDRQEALVIFTSSDKEVKNIQVNSKPKPFPIFQASLTARSQRIRG